jgi:latrophilin 1
MFIVYKGVNELFTSNADLSTPITSTNNNNNNTIAPTTTNIIINSNIISFKMNHNSDIAYLKTAPIELTFAHLHTDTDYQQLEVTPICSYWHYNKRTFDSGHWSSDGCHLKATNKTHTVCQCTHLTHFAILMDIYGVHEQLPEPHQLALTLITIICSVISCISIILTLLAFRFLKIIKKSREQSTTKDLTTITSHLCFCLLASLAVFLAGIGAQKLKARLACSAIALISHYFFLCSFFWMLLEGVQLYFMLVRIFVLDKSPLKRFCLVGYGMPLLIVLASKVCTDVNFDIACQTRIKS